MNKQEKYKNAEQAKSFGILSTLQKKEQYTYTTKQINLRSLVYKLNNNIIVKMVS